MIISEKFKNFTMEWNVENPDNILVDAYDLSYDADADKLILFVDEINQKRTRMHMEKML